ncbi:MAG TPA: TonB-dependent receptor [bacterium]|nr:TonB-dependent receptor [bacterium]
MFGTLLLAATLLVAGETPASAPEDTPMTRSGENTFTMGEIVVTGERIANIEQAGTTTVITGEQLEERGVKTLDEALELVPGVQTQRHTKGFARIRLRGYEQDKVMILVDGVPMNDVYSTDIDLSSIPVRNIAKLVVNRGVSSVLYGTDGAVGTVNVVTRKPDKPFVDAKVEYGAPDSASISVAHGNAIDEFYYWITGTYDEYGGFTPSAALTPEKRLQWFNKLIRYDRFGLTYDEVTIPAKEQYIFDDGKWDHENHRKGTLGLKGGWRITPDIETGLSSSLFVYSGRTNTYQSTCSSDYNVAKEKWSANARPWFTDDITHLKDFALRNRAFVYPLLYRVTVSPYLDARWGDLSLKANLWYFRNHAEQEGYATTDHRYPKDMTLLFTDKNDPTLYEPFRDIKDYGSLGFRLLPTYRFTKDYRMNFALHYRYDTFAADEGAVSATLSPIITATAGGTDPYPNTRIGAHTFYLAGEHELRAGDLRMTAGISYDMQAIDYFRVREGEEYGAAYIVKPDPIILGTRDAFNPAIGFTYDAVKDLLLLRGAASVRARFPNLGEYAKIASAEFDKGLKPERAYNANAGIEFFFLDRKLSIRSDYFISLLDDRIAKISRDDPPVNIQKMVSQGTDTVITAAFKDIGGMVDLSGSLAHSFVHARNYDHSPEEQVNKGKYIEFTPSHQVLAELRIAVNTPHDIFRRTALSVWGSWSYGELIYTMKEAPEEFAPFDTRYWEASTLHNPLFLNARISQELWEYFEISFTAKNLLDDYASHPFNPGPGRSFYLEAAFSWD